MCGSDPKDNPHLPFRNSSSRSEGSQFRTPKHPGGTCFPDATGDHAPELVDLLVATSSPSICVVHINGSILCPIMVSWRERKAFHKWDPVTGQRSVQYVRLTRNMRAYDSLRI
jgi:hypothetical protein